MQQALSLAVRPAVLVAALLTPFSRSSAQVTGGRLPTPDEAARLVGPGAADLTITDVKVTLNGKEIDLGDIKASHNQNAKPETGSVMLATFTLDQAHKEICDWVTFHWVQVAAGDCDAYREGKAIKQPFIDPPEGGHDYYYEDGKARTKPYRKKDGREGNYEYLIDDQPWYLAADGEKAYNEDCKSYWIGDAPSPCPKKGFKRFKTWLVASTGDKKMCLIAGFSWTMNSEKITGPTDLKKPTAAHATEAGDALTNAGFEGWTVEAACNIKCVDEDAAIPRKSGDNDGASWHFKPYYDTNQLYQQWMPPGDVAIPDGATIRSITFFQECNFDYKTSGAKFDRTEIRIGPGAATFGTNARNNWASGNTPQRANWEAAPFSLAGYSSPQASRRPVFNHVLKIPIKYDGSKPLLIEIRHIAKDKTNRITGFNVDRTYPLSYGQRVWRGANCGRGSLSVAGTWVEGGTGTFNLLNNSQTAAGGLLFIGFDFGRVLGGARGVGYALDNLVPGVSSRCHLLADMRVVLPISRGSATLRVPFPKGTAGLRLGAQALYLDPSVPGSIELTRGTYGFVAGPSGTTHGIRYAYFVGNGDTSIHAQVQPTLRGPWNAADTLRIAYEK